MAQGRMLKKRISQSHKFAALKSHNARLLYVLIIPHLDIKGRFEADPKIIKGIIVPLLNFSLRKIWEYEEDMHNVGLIELYKSNGQWYLQATKFSDFQTLRSDHEAKSDCPEPTTDQLRELESPIKVKVSKVKESKAKENKSKYMDFVFLTDVEYQKLIEKFGKRRTKDKIAELNEGIGSKGYKYTSHYFTILSWARRKNKENPPKKCVHCNKMGVYVQNDDAGQPYWLCEDHKAPQKPLPKNTPVPQMRKVPDGVDINDARNKNLDALGVK